MSDIDELGDFNDSESFQSDPKDDLAREIADYYWQQLEQGRNRSEADLIAQYPHLKSQLEAALKRRRMRAAAQDSNPSSSVVGGSTLRQDPRPASLRIRCPNCHESLNVELKGDLTSLKCPACGTPCRLVDLANRPSDDDDAPLKTLGKFDLITVVGQGAFGAVWRARDRELKRDVAIKVPLKGRLSEVELRRFKQEAQIAARLRHPYIVAVHEADTIAGQFYIATDFITGEPLNRFVQRQRLTPFEAAEFCLKVADALAVAHREGVIHRDLKPANIIVRFDAQQRLEPHITDFGLARQETEIMLSLEGSVIGTPAYMSPEQAMGFSREADARSDLYSLGVLLFELCTGKLPYRGEGAALMREVVEADAPPLRTINENVPPDLDTICLKCLEKAPAKRYQSMLQLADDLRAFLANEPITARPITQTERVWRWCLKRKALTGTVLGSVVIVVAVTIIAFIRITAAYERELAERRTAVSMLQSARRSADAWLTGVSEVLEWMPSMNLPRQRLLELAAQEYESFSKLNLSTPDLQLEQGRAWLRVADVRRRLGDIGGAIAAARYAEEKFFKLSADSEVGELARLDLCSAELRLANFALQQGQAEQVADIVTSVLKKADARGTAATASKRDALRVQARLRLAQAKEHFGEFDDALTELQQAQSTLESMSNLTERDEQREHALLAAEVHEAAAHLLTRLGRHDDARQAFEHALLPLQKMLENDEHDPPLRFRRGNLLIESLGTLRVIGDTPRE